jgi:hypothetical protein
MIDNKDLWIKRADELVARGHSARHENGDFRLCAANKGQRPQSFERLLDAHMAERHPERLRASICA